MLTTFAKLFRNWWVFALRGALAVGFGMLVLIWPATTILALIMLFGAFALMEGGLAVLAGFALFGRFERWWVLLLEGLTGIVIGVVTFLWPNVTGLVLVYLIASWAVITGILEIVAAIQFRRVITGEWAMILSGVMSILFGIVLVVFPAAGAVSLAGLIGIYIITFGIIELIFAFRLRGLLGDLKSVGVTA